MVRRRVISWVNRLSLWTSSSPSSFIGLFMVALAQSHGELRSVSQTSARMMHVFKRRLAFRPLVSAGGLFPQAIALSCIVKSKIARTTAVYSERVCVLTALNHREERVQASPEVLSPRWKDICVSAGLRVCVFSCLRVRVRVWKWPCFWSGVQLGRFGSLSLFVSQRGRL